MPVVVRRSVFVALGAAFGLAALCSAAPAQESAATYPSRPITFLVGFAAGGPTDVIARAVAGPLADELGQPVVVENRPGGGGSTAAMALSRAKPDGYTLGSFDVAMVVGPNIVAGATYDPINDFRPIVVSARTPLSFVGSNALPAKTVAELIALAKSKPDEIKLAHAGVGSPPHLGAVTFLQATGTKMVLVPYRGAAPAIQDIIAGHVGLLFTAPSTSIALARDGKVRLLGVTGHERMKSMPDVPTLRESGVDMGALDANQWFGVAAPAGTPDYVVARINAAVNKVLKNKALQEKIGKLEFTVAGGTPEEAAALGRSQAEFWKKTLAATGIKPK
ncbi:MAG: Bug family tripartite tricarboxylate transporter substrate binding protein [Xanthobacteraceae bacterium]